jgi:hypothetical protein
VARNDALPFLFFAVAILLLFGHPRLTLKRTFFAGLMLGLAASSKISYALPAAAIGGMALWHGRTADRPLVAMLASGLFVGGSPILFFLASDTDVFLFFAYRYSIDAVTAWQTHNGSLDALEWPTRLRRFVTFLALGPALVLLIAAAITRRKDEPPGFTRPLGVRPGVLLGATIVAAILPMPSFRQYIMPIIPALVLVVALRGEGLFRRLAHRRFLSRALIGLLMMTSLAGSWRSVSKSIEGPSARRPIAIERNAHRLGRFAQSGSVIGLDPLHLVDSGLSLDPRFATGPFLFRAGNLKACDDPRFCGVTFNHLQRLDTVPPRLVLTGTERRSPRRINGGLDGYLDNWARRRNYRAYRFGNHVLWVAPLTELDPGMN